MRNRRFIPVLAAMSVAAGARGQWPLPIKGVLETYFFSTRLTRGAVQRLTWGEFYYRPQKDVKLTYSFGVFPKGHITDEATVAYDKGASLFRVGRMRTTFGFNDWANIFYNGFNSLPLIRVYPLSDGYVLTRQDLGIEATTTIGDVQIEVAAFDPALSRDQIFPKDVNSGIVRLQAPVGPFIVGLDALSRLRHDGGVYGFDLRYTMPRLVARAEYFNGTGDGSSQGGYVDLQYRPPKLERTQIVGRSEYLVPAGGGLIVRHTLGVRQTVGQYFQLNVNYNWGLNLRNAPSVPAEGLDNFSARAMFQIHF